MGLEISNCCYRPMQMYPFSLGYTKMKQISRGTISIWYLTRLKNEGKPSWDSFYQRYTNHIFLVSVVSHLIIRFDIGNWTILEEVAFTHDFLQWYWPHYVHQKAITGTRYFRMFFTYGNHTKYYFYLPFLTSRHLHNCPTSSELA